MRPSLVAREAFVDMTRLRIVEEKDPDKAIEKAISDRLDAYNEPYLPEAAVRRLVLVGRGADGEINAGLVGVSAVNWFFIAYLWVGEAHRRRGAGSRLLAKAEAVAKARGCDFIYLDSFTFQAPEFYRRHGYREFGRLENCPTGFARVWLIKAL
jgi:GNAT superfamily N-acetyltransferase